MDAKLDLKHSKALGYKQVGSLSRGLKIARLYKQGISNSLPLSEYPSMGALAKILRARASEHSSIFCEQFEQRPKLDGADTLNLQLRVMRGWVFSNANSIYCGFSFSDIPPNEPRCKLVLKFGANQIFWAAREIWAKPLVFKDEFKLFFEYRDINFLFFLFT